MERGPDMDPHWAIEDFEYRFYGFSITEAERQEGMWPLGSERIYGGTPAYLAPGPAFDPRYRNHRGRGPRNYQRPRDRILDDVVAALTREPELDASDVTVDVNNECDVILGGKVTHKADKRLTEDLAADVTGVMDVHNHIRVRRPNP